MLPKDVPPKEDLEFTEKLRSNILRTSLVSFGSIVFISSNVSLH